MVKKAFIAEITVSLFLISLFEMQIVEVTQANFVPIPASPPTIIIVNPMNLSTQPSKTVIEFNATVPLAWLRVIFSYSLDNQPPIEIKPTLLKPATDQWKFTLQNLTDGPHSLIVSVKIGKTESTDNDRTWHFVGVEGTSDPVNFTVDNIAPQILISTPENKTYNEVDIPLSIYVDEALQLSCSLDSQANVTITRNTTLLKLTEGNHSLILYANDTAGNVGTSDTILFTIDTSTPTPSPSPPPTASPNTSPSISPTQQPTPEPSQTPNVSQKNRTSIAVIVGAVIAVAAALGLLFYSVKRSGRK